MTNNCLGEDKHSCIAILFKNTHTHKQLRVVYSMLITCVMKCSRFYCYFNLESITKTSCRVVQFILCLDVTSTNVQKRMFNKQNTILLIYKFDCI